MDSVTCMTMMMSASMTVLRRCATMTVVWPCLRVFSFSCMVHDKPVSSAAPHKQAPQTIMNIASFMPPAQEP